jgi:hypothetical protein
LESTVFKDCCQQSCHEDIGLLKLGVDFDHLTCVGQMKMESMDFDGVVFGSWSKLTRNELGQLQTSCVVFMDHCLEGCREGFAVTNRFSNNFDDLL